jgi:hypothetical protein
MSLTTFDKGKHRISSADATNLHSRDDRKIASPSSSDSDSDPSNSDVDSSSEDSDSDDELSQEFLDSLLEKARQNAIASTSSASANSHSFVEEDVIKLDGDEKELYVRVSAQLQMIL